MRKIITLLLVAALLIPNFAVAQRAETESATPETVTRAEFARVVVRMYNDEIELGQLETRFVDISDHWAYEYIRFLEQRGIIRGDGYGYFRPDDVITLQETVTMLTRALGYQPMANSNGGFPVGYMIAGVTAGVTIDVGSVSLTELVTRDLARTLVNNALDAPFMQRRVRGAPPLRESFLDTAWYGYDVYFDGENFMIGDYKNE